MRRKRDLREDQGMTLVELLVGMAIFGLLMAMVMGLMPVVGVPLPMISYGGTAMLTLMIGFGLIQSAAMHDAGRSRQQGKLR